MPDTKITALTAIGANPIIPSTFPIPMVDLTDTSMAASGTTKKVTVNQILGSGGTATLASATITGDLTVDTSTLKVDSANNRVGVNTASPATDLEVRANGNAEGTIRLYSAIDGSTASPKGSYFSFRSGTGSGTETARLSSLNRFANVLGGDFSISTADTSSVLQNRLTIDSGGVFTFAVGGSTAMTLNSTGLGVGVASPATKLDVRGATNANQATFSGTAGRGLLISTRSDSLADDRTVILNAQFATGSLGQLVIQTAGTDRLLVDSSGNVGIGVTPSAWGGLGTGPGVLQMGNAGCSLLAGGAGFSGTNQFFINNNAYYNATGGSSFKYYRAGGGAAQYSQVGNEHQWKVSSNTPVADTAITFTQAMTLDASGNLLVGTTTAGAKITALAGASGQAAIFQQPAQNFWCVLAHNQATSGDNSFVLFGTEASFTSRGSITYNRAAGQVSYNITSDYRLKEDVKPLTGALNRISSLKPSTYKFKETGFTCEGFIAHELAEVIPAAVTGEKDAVNEDGSIKAQGVDLSKVVPVLVAAIQELAAEVNALKNA